MTNSTTFPGSVSCATSNTSNAMTLGTTKTFVVTVSDASGYNKYYIDGYIQPVLELHQGQTYIFDLSSGTLNGHPFEFSTTNDGSHGGGSAYSTDITTTGTYASSQKRTFVVSASTPTTLYYYCTAHSGMGASVSISSEAELIVSGRVESTDLVVTGTEGTTISVGTTAQRPSNPTTGMIRYNSTIGFLELYTATGWGSITQPPSVASISPTAVSSTGGSIPGFIHKAELITSMSTNSNTAVETDVKFGWSVDITADGTRAIIGVPHDNWSRVVHTGSAPFDYSAFPGHYYGEGSAHIFKKTGDSWAWEQQLFHPEARELDGTVLAETRTGPGYGFPGRNFGGGVTISSDGTIVVVGAPGDGNGKYSSYTSATHPGNSTGSAQVFVRSGTTWTHEASLINTSFAPNAAYFGEYLSISGDGSRVLIGENNRNPNGAAHIFTRNSSTNTWSIEQDLTSLITAGNTNAGFGKSVAISNDGTYAIVGANGDKNGTSVSIGVGYILVRNISTNAWTVQQKLIHPTQGPAGVSTSFGIDVSMSGDGTRVLIGAPFDNSATNVSGTGTAHIFVRSGTSWTHEKELNLEANRNPGIDPLRSGEYFGMGVTVSDDGNTVVVGGPALWEPVYGGAQRAGSAHLYNKSATNDWILNTRLAHPTPGAVDNFGAQIYNTSLAISGDGTHVIVGVPKDDITVGGVIKTDAGSVQVFRAATPEEITNYVYDSSTQVFTVTGAGFLPGSTVQLEGADGTLYSVFDLTLNAAGTQATFKMGGLGASGGYVVANQPYKIRISSTTGMIGTSTAVIAVGGLWATSPANGESLNFETDASTPTTITLSATDGAGGNNVTFSVPTGNLPSELTLVPGTGVITGQPTSVGPVNVTFRVTDNASQHFEDRTFNIWGVIDLYPFNSHTFTTAGITGRLGPTFAQMKTAYGASGWWQTPANFNEISGKQGFQLWTVPETRTYTVKAYGSMGGHPEDGVYGAGYNDYLRGYGAWTQGDFSWTKGDKIVIIVGQEGGGSTTDNDSRGGSGGGASWVLKEDYGGSGATPSSLYLVAGGGGGGSSYGRSADYSVANGGDSQASLITTWVAPAAGATYGSGSGGSYGINGLGNSNAQGLRPYDGATGGYPANTGATYNEPGGFGGGGGNGSHSGGGGAGYLGGIGGEYNTNPGYGGSSRNNGTNITFGVNTVYEEGKVIITRK